jgi:putative salt-induced outer membrane protein
MNTCKLRISMWMLVAGFITIPGVVNADQLHMSNGDIISGTLINVTDDMVTIDPTYGEPYAIAMADVLSIETDEDFDVSLSDGRIVQGKFAGIVDGEQILMVEDQPLSIEIAELADVIEPNLVVVIKPWEGAGELGFVNTTGNTETVALNFRLNFIRNGERWRHRFTGTALTTSEDGFKDNERYTVEVQSDRKLSDIDWLFGAFRFDADKFGSYDPQISLTAGYGRQLMKSERHELKGEIGAGYRKLTETLLNRSSSEAIARFLLDDWWQIFNSTRWTNRLLVEAGSSNTFSQFNTGLAVSMTDRMAIKFGFEARHNTEIPPGDSKNTDTITSANVVYNF